MCRSGLKAELGAFYPLLLLRPIEAERPEPGQLYSALSALQELSTQPQLLVSNQYSPDSLINHHLCAELSKVAVLTVLWKPVKLR